MGKDKKSTISKNSAILAAVTVEKKTKKDLATKNKLVISTSTTMKDKMVVRQNRFPWVSYEKSDMGDNYAWCKICDMSVYMPSSRSGAEHQRTSQHIRLHNERTRKSGQLCRPSVDNTEAVSAVVATAAALGGGPNNDDNGCCNTKLLIKTLCKHSTALQLQKKSPEEKDDSDAEKFDSDSEERRVMPDNTAEPPAKISRQSMSDNIVKRFPTMDREAHPTNVQPSEPRHVMDLFLSSVLQTMKSLPADLAAEGKANIMQMVCELELRAIHRNGPSSPKQSSGLDDDDHRLNHHEESTANKSISGTKDMPNNIRRNACQLQVTSRYDSDYMPMEKSKAKNNATENGSQSYEFSEARPNSGYTPTNTRDQRETPIMAQYSIFQLSE